MEYLRVLMTRRDLAGIPQHPLPDGYAMRAYRPGDMETLFDIWRRSERHARITREMLVRSFEDDLEAMPKRCFFLVGPDGRDIGTATAWYDRRYRRRRWGRVHWVAILPAFRGRGLCKPMVTVVMNRLRRLGHRRAMLATQTVRLPAIRTYLDFGFAPETDTSEAVRAWRLVAAALPHPVLKAVF